MLPSQCKVLMVDDSPADCDVVRSLLSGVPDVRWALTEVGLGSTALREIEKQVPDCILLDYHLPDLTGLEFLQRLRQRFGETGLPVVMLTGWEHALTASEALAAGAQEYLAKNCLSSISLTQSIANATSRHKLLVDNLAQRNALHQAQSELEKQAREIQEGTLVESLQRKNRALERVNEELHVFTNVVSHDLQTPLRNLIQQARFLRSRLGARLDADSSELLDFMASGAADMNHMVEELLRYARAGDEPVPMTQVPLAEVLGAVLRDLDSVIQETGALCIYDQLPVVYGNEIHLRQLLQNLVTNAIQYRRPGEAPRIFITTSRESEQVCVLAVQDEGIGFEPEFAELIFQPFQRLRPCAVPGTGIGLSTCRRIVERLGQQIRATSPGAGRGATFYCTLALAS